MCIFIGDILGMDWQRRLGSQHEMSAVLFVHLGSALEEDTRPGWGYVNLHI